MSLSSFFEKDSFPATATRGLLAGFIGGLVGSALKSSAERFLNVRKIDERSAQIKMMDELAMKLTGTPIKIENEAMVEQLVNIPLGATVGAAYGYGKRYKEKISILDGVILGGTTWASTHETTFPLLGAEKSPEKIPVSLQLNELFAHVIFGVTTEIVRGYIDERLKQRENR